MWARRAWRRGYSSASPLTHADRLLPSLEPNNRDMAEQRKLLSDLGGRFLHACMGKLSRSLLQCYPHVNISGTRIEDNPSWYQTRPTLAKLQALLLLNRMRPQPIFPPADLEALIAAYTLQVPSTKDNYVKGSMLTMAIGVYALPHYGGGSGRGRDPFDFGFEGRDTIDFEGLTFREYIPFFRTRKLLLALFRILFRREVEDVLAQHEEGCLDPLCTISMRRIGTKALPPLLKLYLDQSFGSSHKTRERAAEGLKNLLKFHNEGHLELCDTTSQTVPAFDQF